jgi:hypothetical protein
VGQFENQAIKRVPQLNELLDHIRNNFVATIDHDVHKSQAYTSLNAYYTKFGPAAEVTPNPIYSRSDEDRFSSAYDAPDARVPLERRQAWNMMPNSSELGWVDPEENGGFVIPNAMDAQAVNPYMITYGASERDKRDDVQAQEAGNKGLMRQMAPYGQIDRAEFAAVTDVWYTDPSLAEADASYYKQPPGDILTLNLY